MWGIDQAVVARTWHHMLVTLRLMCSSRLCARCSSAVFRPAVEKRSVCDSCVICQCMSAGGGGDPASYGCPGCGDAVHPSSRPHSAQHTGAQTVVCLADSSTAPNVQHSFLGTADIGDPLKLERDANVSTQPQFCSCTSVCVRLRHVSTANTFTVKSEPKRHAWHICLLDCARFGLSEIAD